MGILNKDKHTFTDPNDINNKKVMGDMFEGTVITELDLDQYPRATLKNKMDAFDDSDL